MAAVVMLAGVGVVTWLVIPGKSRNSSTARPASSGASSASSPATSGPAITGEAAKQVLLDGAELTKMLDQPFNKTVGSPMYGGFDEMAEPSTPPGDCMGVVNIAPKSVYRSADVQSYARETWVDAVPGDAGFIPLSAKVMFVEEAVVALPSAADAQALFTKFSEQWKRCDGRAVNPEPSTPEMHIVDVRVTDTVLAASIVLDKSPHIPDTRAIGVQGNCLVEVFIPFTGAENVTGSGDPKTSSIDAVRAMMDKVSKLS